MNKPIDWHCFIQYKPQNTKALQQTVAASRYSAVNLACID